MRITLCILFNVLVFSGCTETPNSGGLTMKDPLVEADLKAIQAKRILFGHQSVGGNILDGLRDLQNANPGGVLKLVDLEKSSAPSGPFLGELRIGKNGDPASKCRAFGEKAREMLGDSLEIAVMKFCYADFNRETDVAAAIEHYRATVDSLRAVAPRLAIVHTTVPLVVRTAGWKKFVKRILGREESSDVANARRSEFNEMLKTRYRGEPLFDLAAAESTYPDGTREAFTTQGANAYALVSDYSDDGSHLNATGRVIAAREFVRALASVARRSGR